MPTSDQELKREIENLRDKMQRFRANGEREVAQAVSIVLARQQRRLSERLKRRAQAG